MDLRYNLKLRISIPVESLMFYKTHTLNCLCFTKHWLWILIKHLQIETKNHIRKQNQFQLKIYPFSKIERDKLEWRVRQWLIHIYNLPHSCPWWKHCFLKAWCCWATSWSQRDQRWPLGNKEDSLKLQLPLNWKVLNWKMLMCVTSHRTLILISSGKLWMFLEPSMAVLGKKKCESFLLVLTRRRTRLLWPGMA